MPYKLAFSQIIPFCKEHSSNRNKGGRLVLSFCFIISRLKDKNNSSQRWPLFFSREFSGLHNGLFILGLYILDTLWKKKWKN